MQSPVVRLKIRVRLPDDSRPYLDPVFSANGKLKPLSAIVNGKAEHHPEGVYHLRYRRADKRVWEAIGSDPQLALTIQTKREKELAAIAAGIRVIEDGSSLEPEPKSGQKPRPLSDLLIDYLTEIKVHKSRKTLLAYRITLIHLAEYLSKTRLTAKQHNDEKAIEGLFRKLEHLTLSSIDRTVTMGFIGHLKERGNSGRTLNNRATYLRTFVKWAGGQFSLKRNDMPKYTKKKVQAYNEREIGLLFRMPTAMRPICSPFFSAPECAIRKRNMLAGPI